jgi:serine/threonine protein kinase
MAERRQQVEKLFHAALARAPHERESFLTAACASDTLLRDEVESLISAHEQSGSFLDSPAYEITTLPGREADGDSLTGLTVGHYVIHDLIGRGGMGDVYLAVDTRLVRPSVF